MVEAELCTISLAGDQFNTLNQFLGVRAIEQKRIAAKSFMCQASATGLFPGEMLIEKANSKAGGREPFGAQGPGRSSAHNGNMPRGHSFSSPNRWVEFEMNG